jgi:hypothetical protein
MIAGTATQRSFVYDNARGTVETRLELGQTDASLGTLNFALPAQTVGGMPILDSNVLRFDPTTGWWGIDNVSPGRTSIRFPTTVVAPRQIAPLFENGIFYGSPAALTSAGPTASQSITNHIGRTGVPTSGTWEVGDIVWNTAPVPAGPIGWVCTTAGTNDAALVGVTADVDATGLIVTLSSVANIAQWQYVTVDGILNQIISDPGHPPAPLMANQVYVNLGTTPNAVNVVVQFSPATFSTFSPVENVGASVSYSATQPLVLTDRYVTVTVDAQTMTLPASPVDGQTHSIKSQANGAGAPVTTTVDTQGGALNIDGLSTATVGPGQSSTFRYSAATGEWEIR